MTRRLALVLALSAGALLATATPSSAQLADGVCFICDYGCRAGHIGEHVTCRPFGDTGCMMRRGDCSLASADKVLIDGTFQGEYRGEEFAQGAWASHDRACQGEIVVRYYAEPVAADLDRSTAHIEL